MIVTVRGIRQELQETVVRPFPCRLAVRVHPVISG
jgi:hypothetical protein